MTRMRIAITTAMIGMNQISLQKALKASNDLPCLSRDALEWLIWDAGS